MKTIICIIIGFCFGTYQVCFTQNLAADEAVSAPNITLVNAIQYSDVSFTDLPGNGFLIDIGDEILAVTCKHVFWENKPKSMKTISFNGLLKEWRMYVKNDPSQYIILGDLINEDSTEMIGERNTDYDYLVFKIKENHSKIKPLKLAATRASAGDTLYKVGWSFQTKNGPVQMRSLTLYANSGSSLLVDNTIQENSAGMSGSPVINANGELVGIVSSWKYDAGAARWFEAPCATDYLWKVIYSYWCKKNNKTKTIDSFQSFRSYYQKVNGCIPKPSSYLITELFFSAWLKSKGFKNASRENFTVWSERISKKYDGKVIADEYRKSLLILGEWKEDYSKGKKNIKQLEQILADEKVPMPGFIDFCEYAKELSTTGKHKEAIALLQYVAEVIPTMGQIYAFLGDVYSAAGDKTSAKKAYEQCLQTYPGYPMALEGLENR